MRTSLRRLFGAFVPLLLVAGCGGGGGGGGGGSIAFSLISISPAVSNDLTGGDTVTITGTNFVTAGVASVTFGGAAATDRQILSETEMTVKTPPAPGGTPQTVTVIVTSVNAGTKQFTNGYTYANSLPSPQTITPTTFTPTGAEDFTISGTTLGPLGGTVSVVFQGIGTVTGNVSANGQTITGRAAVAAAVPPVGPITVTIDTGAATVDVPTQVAYPYVAPVSLGQPNQTLSNASEPVRLADGFAAFCTAGPDLTWNSPDDDIRILRGPPNVIGTANVPPRGAPGAPVGYLNAVSSIPAVLSPDTFAVYTTGGPLGPGVYLVTLARTTPVADYYSFPLLTPAPVSAIGPNRIAMTRVATLPGPSDELLVQDFNLATAPPMLVLPPAARVAIAFADPTPGPLNFSIPFTADGDTVFCMNVGPNGTPSNQDDMLFIHTVSTATTSPPVPAPFLLGRPIAISASLAVAPGAGVNNIFGGPAPDDMLQVFALAGTWTNTGKPLGQPLNLALALPSYAHVGNGVAVAVTTPFAVKVFTNPVAGTNTTVSVAGFPLFAPLGGGGLAVFGPGPNLVPMTGGDDQAVLIDALGQSQSFSQMPNFFQVVLPGTDADRAFALSPGGDFLFGTNDDLLEVYQSRAISETQNASRLPSAALPAGPLSATSTFVPVGPGWGVVRSPGPNGVFGGPLGLDDAFVILRY